MDTHVKTYHIHVHSEYANDMFMGKLEIVVKLTTFPLW